MVALLTRTGAKITNGPFGQKVQSIKKLEAMPGLSKTACASAAVLAGEIETILDVRNDLVHARLQIAIIGSDQRACFINARQCASGSQTARLFTLQGLREVTAEMGALATEIQRV